MLELAFDFKSIVQASERVSWALDDVFTVDQRLDFTRPFLPDSLASSRRPKR